MTVSLHSFMIPDNRVVLILATFLGCAGLDVIVKCNARRTNFLVAPEVLTLDLFLSISFLRLCLGLRSADRVAFGGIYVA